MNEARQPDDPDGVREHVADQIADESLFLYAVSRNPLFFWDAYLSYRNADLPVPENLLRKIDQFAAALHGANSPSAVAQAMEMRGKESNATGYRTTLKQYAIVKLAHLRIGLGHPHSVVYRETDASSGRPPGSTKTIYNHWLRRTKRPKTTALYDVMRSFGKASS